MELVDLSSVCGVMPCLISAGGLPKCNYSESVAPDGVSCVVVTVSDYAVSIQARGTEVRFQCCLHEWSRMGHRFGICLQLPGGFKLVQSMVLASSNLRFKYARQLI